MLTALKIFAGFVMLIGGAELLVRGATRTAALLGMTPLVIGLTVVAFGTSSPELAVCIQSVFADSAPLAVGNAVGSNTLNVLLILGLSAVVIPLTVRSQVVKLDVPVMIAATIVLLLISLDGEISRWEGLGLFVTLVIYIAILIRIARGETRADRDEARRVREEGGGDDRHFGRFQWPWGVIGICLAMVAGGLIVLGFGCRFFVQGSVELARAIGVSELVIGLTVVSIGTSLPELVTTVIASARGERDMAVGNIVGSNLFNIMCVLGITATVAPGGLPVDAHAVNFDIPVTLAAAMICLPIFFTDMEISRWEGAVMLALYGAYMTYLFLSAWESPSIETFKLAMWWGVIPITVLLLIGSTLWSLRKGQLARSRQPDEKESWKE